MQLVNEYRKFSVIVCFISTKEVTKLWQEAVASTAVASTLSKTTDIELFLCPGGLK